MTSIWGEKIYSHIYFFFTARNIFRGALLARLDELKRLYFDA